MRVAGAITSTTRRSWRSTHTPRARAARSSCPRHAAGAGCALFAPTDAGDAVEELIAVHGRELEQRSEKLLSAVHDLERREERSREPTPASSRSCAKASPSLDQRQAELNAQPEARAA